MTEAIAGLIGIAVFAGGFASAISPALQRERNRRESLQRAMLAREQKIRRQKLRQELGMDDG